MLIQPLDSNITVALIVGGTSTVSVVSPLVLSWSLNRQRAREKLIDYARQDAVAAKVDAAAAQAREAAKLLAESNVASAHVAVQQGQKLDEIHILVNSKLTAIKEELEAAKIKVAELELRLAERLGGGET